MRTPIDPNTGQPVIPRPANPFIQRGPISDLLASAPRLAGAEQQTMPSPNPSLPPGLIGGAPMGPAQTFGNPAQVPMQPVPGPQQPMQPQQPQAAAASAQPLTTLSGNKGGPGDFLNSDAALALAAGILEGGSTGQALGRGFNYALQSRAADRRNQNERGQSARGANATAKFFENAGRPDLAELSRQGMAKDAIDIWQSDKGRPETNISVDTSEESFAKQFGKANADAFHEQRQGALDAVQSLQSSTEARQLLDSGVITGFGADWLVSAGKALQQAGVTFDTDPLANTEAFGATRAQEVGRIIKLFGAGTGLSDADREFASKAAAGQITMNEQSIRRILDINDRASQNVIEKFNAQAETVPEGMSPWPLTVEAPASPAGGGGQGGANFDWSPDSGLRPFQ